jgi:hypothetical protein
MTEAWVDPAELPEDDEEEVSYQVLSFDPGGTTGWALFAVHPDAMAGDPEIPIFPNILWWTAGQFTGLQPDQIDECVGLVEAYPSARLVTEDFKVRQLNALLDPAEINAVLRWAVRPRYFVKQNSALAMGAVTDDRLKSWGFWLPGQEHARDAIRHNITFLKRAKERAIKEAESLRRAS